MKNETKLFLGILLGTIAVVIIGVILLSRSATPGAKVDSSLLIRADSNKIASGSGTITLVEFSDFQCPACGSYYPVVKQIIDDFGQDMTFVYRNFPLTSLHKNARIAAQAAESAGLQGKYWEMHDLLFINQSEWSDSSSPIDIFSQYAKTIGLDITQFKKDLDNSAVLVKINEDIQDGNSLGVSGTPTFYLNGTKLENPASLADFESLIKAEIANAPKPTVTKSEAYHTHFNFKVYLNGTAFDFTPQKYQTNKGKDLNEDIHLHDGKGDLVHIHKKGATLGTFFTSLGMTLTKTGFTDDTGVVYASDTLHTLKMFVNGKPSTQFDSYEPQDLDRILITYGSDNTTIQMQIASVADDACIYSLKCPERGKPPTENCVGGLGTDCTD